MADRRRMSPDGSVRTERTRHEPRRSGYDEREPQRMRPRGADELSSSSSSSSSYLDISRSFPPNKTGILTFFTAPSERRRLRKRRSKKGLFRINAGNSSSSSLDGDLAYGTGFIKQSKRSVRSRKGKEIDRERYSERERDRYRDRDPNRDRDRYSDRERPGSGTGRRPGSGLGRAATDAEILAVGAGLAKLAREQNKADLKSRGSIRKSESFGVNETSFGQSGTSRGLGPSKVSQGQGPDNDEDGWESASDDESDFSVNSALAFDNDNNRSKWKNFFGRRKYKPKSRKSSVVDPRLFGPENSLHGHVDEPVGFADVTWNSSTEFGQGSTFSLVPHDSASVSQQSLTKLDPIATDDGSRYDSGRGSAAPRPYASQSGPSYRGDPRYEAGKGRNSEMPGQFPSQPESPVVVNSRYEGGRGPLVTDQYSSPQSRPAPRSDRYQESSRYQEPPKYQESGKYAEPSKYQESRKYAEPSNYQEPARYQEQSRLQNVRDSAVSGTEPPYVSRRPEPIPLQQPQPITPVSQSIFEPTYPTRSESGGILKKTPSSTGRSSSLAKAALAGVAVVGAGTAIAAARDDRKERKREEELEDLERERLRRRESEKKENKDDRRREKRSTSDRDDKKEKSRDKDKDKDKKRSDSDEKRREKKQETRRDETRDEKEERREKRREERRSERSDYDPRGSTRSEVSAVTAPIDPFMFQVRDDAFPTPTAESIEGHRRVESVPSIVTVEREPDFTRKRSYSIKEPSSNYEPEPSRNYFPPQEPIRELQDREERDRPLHKAEEILEETRHSTAPYDSVIISTVIAAEEERKSRSERRRTERKGDYDYTRNDRDREPEKKRDPVQEEADKAYREIVMARKIASEVIRQRTPSPNRSVVDKYEEDVEEEVFKIVTPPEMADEKKKGPYDAPNADFVHDYEFQSPTEVHTFIIPELSMTRSLPPGTLPKRDPDTIKPRPILNLVRPTPTPSPVPEKQIERSQSKPRRSRSGEREQSKRSSASEVAVSTEREPQPRYAASDVVIGPKGNVVVSPTASTVSKGVTWGENETKHYEVESPSDHREEFISSAEVRTREVPEEIKQGASSKTRGWSALAGTIMGIGAVGTVAAASGDNATSSQSKEEEKKPASAYEYRGVVVEPDSPPRSRKSSPPRDSRQASPPAPGPKPTISQTSHMPGSFDDDIEFTAAVAAGLQDTGFNPDIVINDPAFRRRDSPPGSNDAPIYRAPFAETVSDLGTIRSDLPGAQGFVIGEVASTPRDWQSVSPPRENETPTKLSKKEQKKRDKARRQSGDVTPLDETPITREVVEEPESYFVEPKLSKKDQKKLDKNRRQSGDVTPLDEPLYSREIEVVEEPESYFVEPKLSKKEQKKRDKEAQRQRSITEDVSPPVEPSLLEQIVVEPEPYYETPKKSKKSKNGTSSFDETLDDSSRVSRNVSVPVDAYADLTNGDDEWATETKKSKKSKRDSDRYDSPARSVPSSEVGTEERSSSKKSKRDSSRYDSPARSEVSSEVGSSKKDRSKRRSESYDVDPTEVSLPPSTPSEAGEFDDSRRTRKSSGRDSGIFSSTDRGDSRSVVSAGASRYDDEEPRKSKKKSRSGTKDDFDDTRSVASAPAGDDWDDSKKSKKKDKKDEKRSSGFFGGFFGSKSESGARDESPKGSKDDTEDAKKKKKKRSSTGDASSLYGGIGATSVSDLSRSVSVSNGKSNGNGSHHDYDQYEDGTRSDGEREKKKKSRSRSESTSSKKDSFLGNAGTLGAGVGIAGAAVAIAAQQYRQSKAANTNDSEITENSRSMSLERPSEREEALDPDIQHRVFRPSIDPQYGDLLPLPPSGPTSPNVEPTDELPELPDSRPGTPEADRVARERAMSAITSFRKSQQDTPTKSPSQSAVPVRFLLGNRSTPPSPVPVRSSPMQSPAAPNQEPLGFPKFKSRPTSWEGSKEFRPLYLVESHRRGSNAQLAEAEAAALPPSQSTSRSSSQHDFGSRDLDEHRYDSANPLSIDTALARSASPVELLGSEQSTPKALFHDRDTEFSVNPLETPKATEGDYDLPSRPRERSSSPTAKTKSGVSGEDIAAGVAVAGLAAVAGHFISSSMHKKDDVSDDIPLIERRPSPVDAVTKDRSSYLLKSSPIPSRFDDVNTDSPIQQPNFSSSLDMLHSIDEGDSSTTLVSSEEIQREREKALESLSGAATPQEDLIEDSVSRGIPEAEPSDEFAFTKSKKSKKDKRKSKGLSQSSTQGDLPSFADASEVATSEPLVLAAEDPVIEPAVKSKADKKKSKKKSKSFMGWGETEEEQQQPEDLGFEQLGSAPDPLSVPPSLFPDRTERAEESSSFQSSKSMKGKSIEQPEPVPEPQTEEETDEFHDALDEAALDAPEIVPNSEESQPVDDFFTSSSKKDKKRDKKKSKSFSLEPEPIVPEVTSETPTELHEDVFEDAQAPVEEPTQEFSFSNSKKSKKDKKKGKLIASLDNAEPEETQSMSENTREIVDDMPIVTEQSTEDNFSFSKSSKKDKKKRKSQVTFDPDVQAFEEPAALESSKEITEDAAVMIEQPVEEDVSFSKSSKKDKKKRKSQSSFDPETLPIDDSKTPEVTRAFVEDVPNEAEQTIEDFSFAKPSKKDKKKRKSQIILDKPEITSTYDHVVPESSREIAEETSLADEGLATHEPLLSDKEIVPDVEAGVSTSESVSVEVHHLTVDETSHGGVAITKSNNLAVVADPSTAAKTAVPEFLDPSASYQEGDSTPETISTSDRNLTGETSTPDGFAAFEGKKSKKKKRKSGTSWEAEEDSAPTESSSKLPETSLELEPVPEATAVDEFVVPEIKKGKKNKGKSILVDDFVDEPLPIIIPPQESEDSIAITQPTSKKDKKKGKKSQSFSLDDTSFDQPVEDSTTQGDIPVLGSSTMDDTPVDQDFESMAPTSSKKSKKKSKKSQFTAFEPEALEDQDVLANTEKSEATDTIAEPEILEDFTTTKKSKKKSKKSQFETFEPETFPDQDEAATFTPESNMEPEITAKPEDFEEFTSSKKNKKKSKKSQFTAFESETFADQDAPVITEKSAETENAVDLEPLEDFASSKKSKKKSRKSQIINVGEEESSAPTANDDFKAVEPENSAIPVIETPSSKPTPIGGPGAWPITPATPRTGGEADESTSKGYFATAAALLPAAAAGAALLVTRPFRKESLSIDESMPVDKTAAKSLESEEFNTPADNPEPEGFTPDGLKAGYKDEQLSLARQLQEEFASGNKKSKKDKKKRQSLPSTPDRLPSRSRAIDDLVEDHHRARSLSTGPSAERSGESPVNTERTNIYSEEHLELAKQLRAEFDSKKSKKEKKGRKGRSLTQDDDFANQDADEPQDSGVGTPQGNIPEAAPRGDGFAAGYQEDQLSLAKQLQIEFGSGSTSKKSKKDKKRRSTSQTPLEQEPVDDYFGEQSRSAEPIQLDEASHAPESLVPTPAAPVRDGLAVGYNQDQLELARQMQEEFAAKKSKKDKKEKKRQSLIRGTTEDDFSSDAPQEARDFVEPSNIETPSRVASLDSYNTLLAEPEDELPAFGKKSKKEKKAKKRGSLLRGTTDEDVGSDDVPKDFEPLDEGLPQDVAEEGSSEPVPFQPDDEFITSKKSKKDRKGKKRESSVQADAEEIPIPDLTPAAENIESGLPDTVGTSREIVPEIEEDFTPTKKSKKEKKSKKRDSLMQADTEDLPTPDPELSYSPANDESAEPDVIGHTAETALVEIEDEFAPTKRSKKEKKSKKKDSLMQADVEQSPLPDLVSTPLETEIDQSDIVREFHEAGSIDAEDEFAPVKKSKKEKKNKKRDSIMVDKDNAESSNIAIAEPDTSREEASPKSVFTQEPISLISEPQEHDLPTISAEHVAVDEPEAEFFTSTKKSKKDKKVKKSESIAPDSFPDVAIEETSRDLPEPAPVDSEPQTPIVPADEDFDFPVKKSKKDKKKRQSMIVQEESAPQQESDDVAAQMEPPSEPSGTEIGAYGATPNVEDSFDDFSSKKSKKDKKKRQSMVAQEESVSQQKSTDVPSEVVLPSEPFSTEIEASRTTTDVVHDNFDDFSSKKSKKDKKKRQSLLRGSAFDGSPESESLTEGKDLEPESQELGWLEPSASTPLDDGPDENVEFGSKKSKKDKKKKKNLQQSENVDQEVASMEIGSTLDPVISEPAPEVLLEESISKEAENSEDLFGDYALSKKSKKDKKKRKDSGKTDSAEASGYSTPLDPLSEALEMPVQSDNVTEQTVVPESLETISEKDTIPQVELPVPADDEWGSISHKNSKKVQSKGKKSAKSDFEESSDPSTPFEPASEPSVPTFSTQPTSIEPSVERGTDSSIPLATQDPSDEPLDEWGPTKKSKKDKKQRGSSKLEFEEPGPEKSEFLPQSEPITTFSDEPEVLEQSLGAEPSFKAESVLKEPIAESLDDWTPKKSKKDKKTRKDSSKVDFEDASSTPFEPAAEPVEAIIPSLSTESTAFDAVQDREIEPVEDSNTQEIVNEPLEEWASTKKSKKDKKKRKDSSKFDVEEPTPLPLHETDAHDEAQPSQSRDLVEPSPNTYEIPEEPQDEFPLSRKNSKKVKKNRKGSAKVDFEEPEDSTNQAEEQTVPLPEAIHASLPTTELVEHAVLEQSPQQDLDVSKEVFNEVPIEESFEEWAPPKKSKKDKKKGKSLTTFDVEESQSSSSVLEPVKEPLEEAAYTSLPVEESAEKENLDLVSAPADEPNIEPFEEWAPTKKSKKDKKKGKSLATFDVEEPAEKENLDLVSAPTDEPTVEPFEEWAPTKKSKKDKKKGKSLTPFDVEESQGPSSVLEPVKEPLEEAACTSLPVEEPAEKDNLDLVSAPVDEPNIEPFEEWAPTKKSKKDKKKGKSLATFDVEEPLTPPAPLESGPEPSEKALNTLLPSEDPTEKDILDRAPGPDTPTVPVEEPNVETFEDFAPAKKSKKDKKKKKDPAKWNDDIPSDATTLQPVEETFETSMPSSEPSQTHILEQASEEMVTAPITDDAPTNEPFEEWAPTKKSKKDKKKRNDSTAVDVEKQLESSAPVEATSEEQVVDPLSLDSPQELTQEPESEWEGASIKKSKKDKKNRKSGLSTPIEGVVAASALAGALAIASTQSNDNSSSKEATLETRDDPIATEKPENEWDASFTKNSKKDKKKRKSGISTPFEEALESSQPIIDNHEQLAKDSQDTSNEPQEISSQESKAVIPMEPEIIEPVDDWGSVPVKKSKKDKKRKSGLSTPVEEFATEVKRDVPDETIELSSSKDISFEQPQSAPEPVDLKFSTETPFQDIINEPEDDWGSVPVKKSKKDKKKKSGLSTPIEGFIPDVSENVLEEPTEPSSSKKILFEEPVLSAEPLSIDHAMETPSREVVDEPEDEWGGTFSKKSKKDKKKRKSEISTPVQPVQEPVKSSFDEKDSATFDDPTEPIEGSQDVAAVIKSKDISNEPSDEWSGSFETKKSKKDKKKRKSGLSTPIEETLPAEREVAFLDNSTKTVTHPGPIDLFHAPASSSAAFDSEPRARDQTVVEVNMSEEISLDPTVQGTQFLESPVEEARDEDATEDPFAFVTKRSKKEKKGKQASKLDFESEPSTSTPVRALPLEKAEPSLTESEFPVVAPNIEEPRAIEPEILSSASKTINPLDTDKPSVVEEQTEPLTISRKSSKKDKRKRQPTIDATTSESGSSKPPLTSWADDIEEATVVRDLPVIEEIAKDESLAHIPIMSPSTDDFVRPSKKGKKTSRRKESLTEPIIEPSTSERDAQSKDSKDKDVNASIAAAAGVAAVAAAALISKSENSASSNIATPVRKLSKKEQRKMSIDKRAPREDMFDDPALWEGADPMVYEETKGGEDDEGSDGFWSPPQEEVEEPAPQELQEPSTQTYSHDRPSPIDTHFETARALSPPTTPEPHIPTILPQPAKQPEIAPESESQSFEQSSQNSRSIAPSDDTSSEFFVASSKKGKKKKESKNAKPRISEEPIEDSQTVSPTTTRTFHEPPTTIVEGPPSSKGISFDERPPISQEHIISPLKYLDHQDYSQRRALSPEFERSSPTSSRIGTPRSSRPRLSDLTIVLEENPAQVEAAHHSQRHEYLGQEPNRDSGFSTDSPIVHQKGFADHHEHVRDSGVHLREDSPAGRSRAPVSSTDDALARLSWPSVDEDTETVDLHRSQRPKISASKKHAHEVEKTPEAHDSKRSRSEKISDVYRSQKKNEEPTVLGRPEKTLNNRDLLPSQIKDEPHVDLHRTPTVHGRKLGESSLVKQRMQKFESPDLPKPTFPKNESQGPEIRKLDLRKDDLQRSQSPKLDHSRTPKLDKYAELNSTPIPRAEKPQGISDLQTAGVVAGVAIAGASLGFAAARKISQEKRPDSAQGLKSSPNINRLRTPDIKRPDSVGSNRSATPPLRRTDRQLSGDLRSLSQRSKPDLAKEAELAATTASAVNTANPTANEGRVRSKDMADVYDGFGEGRMGSPRSPTRPHSMRRRQSMQVLDLESKVEQLAAENCMLAEAKAQVERTLMSNQTASSSLLEKDSEIDSLKRTLDWLQNEVQRLTEVNEGLTSANVVIARQHSDRYGMLESEHAEVSRELQETRDAHNNLTAGMDGIVKNEIQTAVAEKDRVIAQLRAELDTAKERIREMQRQILASKAGDVDFLTIRDEDYFDNACQQLCQHVQQWVLRFSKFSDMRACRLTSEINNDKTIDRLDNAILDGSDVDSYLADRVKRRDVFMSMTMTMVWEFVFTRYLFGMDREQRQKLKSLEKTLSEVGPEAAVHQWRATTLTLLAKREAFAQQREQDTQAVVHAILETLSEILPPPSHLETQIEEQLMRVMKAAVDLSIEMRTQRAEYMMLPPLQPEYDANGDLASKVSFNSALMNERSGDTVSNEDLETQKAVVRIVLFPLVVKKGNDKGEGDEEIVVCPAQVLVAKAKKARFMEGNHSRVSMQSTMPAGEESVI